MELEERFDEKRKEIAASNSECYGIQGDLRVMLSYD